jgi:DNA-binding MltR family transcriptional regulator
VNKAVPSGEADSGRDARWPDARIPTLPQKAREGWGNLQRRAIVLFMTKGEARSDLPKVNPYPGPRRGKPFDEKLTKDETEEFYAARRDRDRAIVLSAIAENHLTSLLQLLMLRHEKEVSQQLFNPSGPLGPFGTKIRVAYMLRIVPPELYSDLMTVSKIRNKFAHDLSVKSFESPQIRDWVKGMHHYKMFLSSVSTFKKKAERERSLPEAERKFQTTAYVLGNSAETIADSYRETVRLIIHWIVDYEDHIRSEEKRINSERDNARVAPTPRKP